MVPSLINQLPVTQFHHHLIRQTLGGLIHRAQMHLRRQRRLVGRIDAGEVLDLTGVGLGIEAVGVAFAAFIDVDWVLPDMTGVQVLDEIRERRDSLPVLFLTGRDSEHQILLTMASAVSFSGSIISNPLFCK